ncbi:MAG: type II secretion system F family protein [Planctomycetes bacterium]|nr:type II secretion system F family protein [Planctomycetota bacterium]
MSAALLPLLTFLAIVLTIVGAYSLASDLFLRDRKRIQERFDEEFHKKQRERARQSLLFKDVDLIRQESSEFAQRPYRPLSVRCQNLLDQSGLEMTPVWLMYSSLTCAVISALVLGILLRSFLWGIAGLFLGCWLPLLFVRWKRNHRQEALRRQLADGFDLMARILRAGQSLSQAMRGVAHEFPSPIAEEFAYTSEQQNLGLAPDIAMRDLARRTGVVEINIFVVAVLVQRQVGGNLSEVLENLAKVVRERFRTRGSIRTLTAEGRLQAAVLMALPPLLFGVMLVTNYDYARTLLDTPILLWGMAGCMMLGGLWIHKIVDFDF